MKLEKLKTILVCANLKTKQTLAEFLSAYDYDVVLSTQYAFECIETFEQTSVDVVIADTFVYDLELCELLRRLRLLDPGANTLFVITSKAADLSLESKLDLCAPDLFTLIPTDFDSLDKKIRYSLEQKRQTAIETRKYQSDEFKTRTNIRYLDFEQVTDEISFVSIDVSFISLKLVLPVAFELLADNGELVALIKPQFEAGREEVGKKGVVRDPEVHRSVIEKITGFAHELGFSVKGLDFSPIKGPEGNIEYLMYLSKDGNNSTIITGEIIDTVVENSHSM